MFIILRMLDITVLIQVELLLWNIQILSQLVQGQKIVQGDQGTLIVSGASSGVCKDVFFDAPKKDQIGKKAVDTKEKISIEQPNHMLYECKDFMDIILNKDDKAYTTYKEQTQMVVELLEKLS